jgi:hypothetical protein
MLIRVYKVGVVSILVRAPFECGALRELSPMHQAVTTDRRPLEQIAREYCIDVCQNLAA